MKNWYHNCTLPKFPKKIWIGFWIERFAPFGEIVASFHFIAFLGCFRPFFQLKNSKKLKFTTKGQFWSLRPNSRSLGVPRTSVTTILVASWKFHFFYLAGDFGHPYDHMWSVQLGHFMPACLRILRMTDGNGSDSHVKKRRKKGSPVFRSLVIRSLFLYSLIQLFFPLIHSYFTPKKTSTTSQIILCYFDI